MNEKIQTTIIFPLFGARIRIILYDIEPVIGAALQEEIEVEALRLQRIFNVYDSESELSRLNKKRKMPCSKEMIEVLNEALFWCEQTQGIYDITKGRAFLERKAGKEITPVHCSYRDVRVSGNTVSLSHPDALIDLGSIAKGYITDKLIEFIHGLGIEGAFIDARGDLRISGPHHEIVDIQHPRTEEAAGTLILENSAVATSGDYRQNTGVYENSHLVGATCASVTVIAPTLMLADVVATVLSLTPDSVLPQEISAFIINKDGSIQQIGKPFLLAEVSA